MKPKPNEYGQINMRGFKKVYMVTVHEGEGTPENPSCLVNYIFDDETDQYLGTVQTDAFTHDYLNKDL